jgi:hypothetical protein
MQLTDNVAVILPKSMKFEPGSGTSFATVPDDPNAQTFLVRNVKPGQALDFSVSGTGAFPRDTQAGTGGGPQSGGPMQGGTDSAAPNGPGGKPGGGLGDPIGTDDPISKYKWWIFGGLALILAAAAAFLLRRPAGAPATLPPPIPPAEPQIAAFAVKSPQTKSQLLLEALKEELFAIESEKIAGQLSPEQYIELKSALETVLRRALARK